MDDGYKKGNSMNLSEDLQSWFLDDTYFFIKIDDTYFFINFAIHDWSFYGYIVKN
jgi:hypothetical protein